MDFWLNLKKRGGDWLGKMKGLPGQVNIWLERDPNRARLLIWRNRISRALIYLDKHLFRIAAIIVLAIFAYSTMYFLYWRAPRPFPEQALITVERGESLSAIVNNFEQKGIVRSSLWLRAFIMLLDGERNAIAGDYYFPEPVSVFKVAKMLHNGEFGLIAIKITLPEGVSSMEMAEILAKELPAFNPEDFVNEVLDNNYEGYLFPDTYFLTPNTKASNVILMMRENFARQIKPYEADILKSEKSLNDLVIMASIIEDEANGTLDSKRIVSGILCHSKLTRPFNITTAKILTL